MSPPPQRVSRAWGRPLETFQIKTKVKTPLPLVKGVSRGSSPPLPTPSPLSVCAALPASRSVTLPVLVLGEGALLPAGMTVNSRRAWEGAGRTDPQLPPHSAVQVFPCTSHAPSRNPMGHCFGVRTAAV